MATIKKTILQKASSKNIMISKEERCLNSRFELPGVVGVEILDMVCGCALPTRGEYKDEIRCKGILSLNTTSLQDQGEDTTGIKFLLYVQSLSFSKLIENCCCKFI